MYIPRDTVLIELNQICNLQCEYCFYNDHGRQKDYLSIDMLSSILSPAITKIFLTGGEPFLNPDILEILHFINNKKLECTVFCNGIALDKLKEKEINDVIYCVDKLIISFDSFNDDYSLRSVHYLPILNIIDKVLSYDANILEIKIGLNKYNVKEFEYILCALIKRGVKKFSINLIHDIQNSKKQFEIKNKNEILKIYKIVDKYIDYFDTKYVNFHKQYIDGDIDNLVTTCKAGKSFYFINNNGKVFGCPAHLKDIPTNRNECISKKCINLWEMY